jgi:hypothetical protein
MRLFLTALLFSALFAIALPAFAYHEALQEGQAMEFPMAACPTKDVAVGVVKKDVEKGEDAASLVFTLAGCRLIMFGGELIGKTVFSAKVKREGEEKMFYVVEALDPETKKPLAYFFTDYPILKGKPV